MLATKATDRVLHLAPLPKGTAPAERLIPYRGAPQTVGVLVDAALDSQRTYAVRQLAEAFCSGLDSKDYASEYLAIYYGVLQTTRYMRDPRTVELVRSPKMIAESILRGERPNLDCDDLSTLIAALTLSVGGASRLVTVAFQNMFFNGERQYSHVFAQAQVPQTGAWVIIDPVAAENTPSMRRRIVAAKTWRVA